MVEAVVEATTGAVSTTGAVTTAAVVVVVVLGARGLRGFPEPVPLEPVADLVAFALELVDDCFGILYSIITSIF